MTEQVGYEKGRKYAYVLDDHGKKWWYEITRAAVEAERPALIDEVLDAVREELQRGQYGFSESYFRWDRVRARLAEPAKEEQVKDGRAEEHLSDFKSGGLSPFAPREIEDFRAPQPGESTQPSYVAYMAMTPAEREACVQKAEEISQPQIHDAILAKMVADLVLRVDALENGAK